MNNIQIFPSPESSTILGGLPTSSKRAFELKNWGLSAIAEVSPDKVDQATKAFFVKDVLYTKTPFASSGSTEVFNDSTTSSQVRNLRNISGKKTPNNKIFIATSLRFEIAEGLVDVKEETLSKATYAYDASKTKLSRGSFTLTCSGNEILSNKRIEEALPYDMPAEGLRQGDIEIGLPLLLLPSSDLNISFTAGANPDVAKDALLVSIDGYSFKLS